MQKRLNIFFVICLLVLGAAVAACYVDCDRRIKRAAAARLIDAWYIDNLYERTQTPYPQLPTREEERRLQDALSAIERQRAQDLDE